jgi:hypothetical protein
MAGSWDSMSASQVACSWESDENRTFSSNLKVGKDGADSLAELSKPVSGVLDKVAR